MYDDEPSCSSRKLGFDKAVGDSEYRYTIFYNNFDNFLHPIIQVFYFLYPLHLGVRFQYLPILPPFTFFWAFLFFFVVLGDIVMLSECKTTASSLKSDFQLLYNAYQTLVSYPNFSSLQNATFTNVRYISCFVTLEIYFLQITESSYIIIHLAL